MIGIPLTWNTVLDIQEEEHIDFSMSHFSIVISLNKTTIGVGHGNHCMHN